MLADGPAHGAIFLVDRAGLLQEAGGDFRDRTGCPAAAKLAGRRFHAIQGPEEIHGRRPARGQVGGDLFQALEDGGLVLPCRGLQPEADAIGRGDADGRGPADPQQLDRFPDRFHVAAIDLDQLDRQPRLVDHPQVAVRTAEPL